MLLNPTVIAIPIFALLVAVEAYLVIRENRENFDSKDTWSNIFIGFMSVAWGALFGLATSLIDGRVYGVSQVKIFPLGASKRQTASSLIES